MNISSLTDNHRMHFIRNVLNLFLILQNISFSYVFQGPTQVPLLPRNFLYTLRSGILFESTLHPLQTKKQILIRYKVNGKGRKETEGKDSKGGRKNKGMKAHTTSMLRELQSPWNLGIISEPYLTINKQPCIVHSRVMVLLLQ